MGRSQPHHGAEPATGIGVDTLMERSQPSVPSNAALVKPRPELKCDSDGRAEPERIDSDSPGARAGAAA
jgi:hypothetical protein